jgi:copper resistance protein C
MASNVPAGEIRERMMVRDGAASPQAPLPPGTDEDRSMALSRLMFRTLATGAFAVALTTGATRTPWHTRLLKSAPAANDTIAAAPKAITLTFSERVDLAVSRFRLSDAKGAAVGLGQAKFDDAQKGTVVVVPVSAAMGRGAYTVRWSVASDDGHPVKGTFVFVVR